MTVETQARSRLPHLSSDKQLTFLKLAVLSMAAILSFATRLFSVLRFESVIHEFDPYFNYRTTRFLTEEGFYSFHNWFDDRAWYPLGRIIGGTIYPGLMVTSAALYNVMQFLNITIDIRNVCVFLAPFFSSLTTIVTYLLTKELKNEGAGLVAAGMIAIVPGYISRSVAGSYDNEGIAIFCMLLTYYFWIKAVNTGTILWGTMCALAYFYMVSSWGGYVFLINLIPLHVLALMLLGRFSARVYVAYSTLYCVGTILSMQISFVGFQPVQSSEHMLALGTFGLCQLYAFTQYLRTHLSPANFELLFKALVTTLLATLGTGVVILTATGKISPWTGRFYSLLDPSYAKNHIPIIASVSEHQPTSWASFYFDLQVLVFLFPAGLYFCFTKLTDANIFIILYGVLSIYFAFPNTTQHHPIIAQHLPSISLHPPCTSKFAPFGNIPHSFYFDLQVLVFLFPAGLYFCFTKLTDANIFIILYGVLSIYFAFPNTIQHPPIIAQHLPSVSLHPPCISKFAPFVNIPYSFYFDLQVLVFLFPAGLYFCFTKLTDANIFIILYGVLSIYFAGVMVRLMLVLAPVMCIVSGIAASSLLSLHVKDIEPKVEKHDKKKKHENNLVFRSEVGALFVTVLGCFLISYVFHCTWVTSEAYSSPSIVLSARAHDGARIIFDDFREAYTWLKMNTPEDAKVMSWWDYGYQITAMANRTVIVDNNTWNNTHISRVGQAMASSEEKAYEIMKELDVDYVLVIFGGLIGYSSDDINKFLWMVRIGGSTDRGAHIKEADYYTPNGEFRVDQDGSNTLLNCLMYKMSYYKFGLVYTEGVDKTNYYTPNGEFRVDQDGSNTLLNCLMYKMSYYKFGLVYTEGGRPPGFDRVRGAEIGNKDFNLDVLEEAYTTEHWLVRIYKVKPLPNRGQQ
ncbi:oligosaccharyl transferase STT3 subunit domain-containing protein [Phthorimaea operculella]|nr:oligosaccharyl transferase STT3 subunit domain-containing protein [Phthorimaea operculella]